MSTADDVEAAILDNLDAFGRLTVRGERNDADIGANYLGAPERLRLYVDGTREFPQYAADPTNPSGLPYEHAADVHKLSPAAGETVTYWTAEQFRYVVQYVKALSWAMDVSRDLQDGEYITVGAFTGTPGSLDPTDAGSDIDGWPLYFDSTIAPDGSTGHAYITRDGSIKATDTLQFSSGFGDWKRYLTEPNWYNVGDAPTTETYTEDNRQVNVERGTVAVTGDRGPTTGNVHVGVEVHAEASGLEVNFGSVGVATYGNVDAIFKAKGSEYDGLSHSGGGQYEPLLALKVADDRSDVAMQLAFLEPLVTPGTADEVLIISVDPSKTDADFDDPDDDGTAEGPAAPTEHNRANSALRYTKAVSTFPDATGSVVTATDNPGGWQIGHSSARSQNKNDVGRATRSTRKRGLGLDGDIAIVLGLTESAGDFDIELDTEEDS